MADGFYIDPDDWPDFRDLLRAYRAGALGSRPSETPQRVTDDMGLAVVCLLEELKSGTTVVAERLRFEGSLQVIDVAAVGYPGSQQDAFKLRLKFGNTDFGETEEIELSATADEFAAAFDAGAALMFSDALHSVSLGNSEDYQIMRWRLALRRPGELGLTIGEDDDDEWTLLINDQTYASQLSGDGALLIQRAQYVGTGQQVQLHAPIPTGHPTPARAGAIGVAVPFPGLGWGLLALEARKFSTLFAATGGGSS